MPATLYAGCAPRGACCKEDATMKVLTTDQVDAYRCDGFLFPFDVLGEQQRRECLAGLERFERWLGKQVNQAEVRWRTMPYLHLPWANALARHPNILDVVEDLIGPDILIWTSTFFIKEANSPTYAAWHQDGTYFGHEPQELVTAWVALTAASHEAGCMECLSFNGAPRQLQHRTLGLAHSINRAGQTIVEPVDDRDAVAMPLAPGQFSLHNYWSVHRSGPNRASHRRVGLGLNFMPAHTRPIATGVKPAAMLVRGEDRHGHFELMPPPTAEFDAASLAVHEHANALYRKNYAEIEALHEGKPAQQTRQLA
jgi:ectoine hydroxylase-related dioxygenase (phytanoyl-CoA dioxygenase family)